MESYEGNDVVSISFGREHFLECLLLGFGSMISDSI